MCFSVFSRGMFQNTHVFSVFFGVAHLPPESGDIHRPLINTARTPTGKLFGEKHIPKVDGKVDVPRWRGEHFFKLYNISFQEHFS